MTQTLSVENQKEVQILGFVHCLEVFLSRYEIRCCKDKLFRHLQNQFVNIKDLTQLPKLFKLSLATLYSNIMEQEFPEDSQKAIKLFPANVFNCIKSYIYKSNVKKCRIMWDLLQCKDNAARVPNSFIQLAYEKHAKTLSTVGVSPPNVLNQMRKFFHEYCVEVKNCFKNKSTLPPKSAYFNTKKSDGGCLSHFIKNKLITSNVFENRSNSDQRIDPIVIHLVGKPGKGKSYMVNSITKMLSKRFGYNINSNYSRSIATDHWDGYNGELCSTIDDLFSDSDSIEDCKMILQLCSNVDYVLPMADLKDKGIKFTSDFLIITSNKPQSITKYANRSVVNHEAVFRRVYPCYNFMERTEDKYRVQKEFFNSDHFIFTQGPIQDFNFKELSEKIVEEAIQEHRKRNQKTDFIVPVASEGPFGKPSIGFKVPMEPPNRLPKVMAHGIPEPLKVRIITKGEEENWVLKPVQKAMWEALKAFPCFSLTNNPELPLEFISNWKQMTYLLSGDYAAATDNLNMDITQLALDELKNVIPEPFKSWMLWEGGAHEICYPPKTNIPSFIQTRGQLMGSLLSFPILCVANAACISIIKGLESLKDLEACINGDDILFLEHERKIKAWKRLTHSIGLEPSIGKNFQSPMFGTINSQLIFRENNKFSHIMTGCFGALEKTSQFLQNIKIALKVDPNCKSYVVKKAKNLLKKTHQSIDISTDFGGLGFVSTKECLMIDRENYFCLLLEKSLRKIRDMDDEIIYHIPKHLYKMYKGILGPKCVEIPDIDIESKDSDILAGLVTCQKLRKFRRFYQRNPILRDRVKTSILEKEIPLHLIKNVTVRIPKSCSPLVENLKMHI